MHNRIATYCLNCTIIGLTLFGSVHSVFSQTSQPRRSLATSGANLSNSNNKNSNSNSSSNRNNSTSKNSTSSNNQQNTNSKQASTRTPQTNPTTVTNRGANPNPQNINANRGNQSNAPKAQANSKDKGPATAGQGQLKMVDKTMIEVLRTRKVDYSEDIAAASPTVIILNQRVLSPEKSLIERESVLVRQSKEMALEQKIAKIPNDLFEFLGTLN